METEKERDEHPVDRRKLLRRAGAIAAGVAGVSVAGAVVAAPASGANDDPVLVGGSFTGDTTTLTTTSDSAPALSLVNTDPTAPSLGVSPFVFFETVPTENGPVGSVLADDWGDFYGIGDPFGAGRYVNPLYSPNWAAMPIPITPFRVLDSRYASGRDHVVPGSALYDGSGRVLSGGSGANLILDLSDFIIPSDFMYPAPWIGAVQMNLTAVLGTSSGYVTVWPGGPVPNTSALNFPKSTAIANFCQVPVDPTDSTISLKVSLSVALIADIVGFVVADPIRQINFFNLPSMAGSPPTGRPRRKQRLPN